MSTSEYPDTTGQVVFLKSFSEDQRSHLLARCSCVVYTPENEHFGIVPIEVRHWCLFFPGRNSSFSSQA